MLLLTFSWKNFFLYLIQIENRHYLTFIYRPFEASLLFDLQIKMEMICKWRHFTATLTKKNKYQNLTQKINCLLHSHPASQIQLCLLLCQCFTSASSPPGAVWGEKQRGSLPWVQKLLGRKISNKYSNGLMFFDFENLFLLW